MTATLHIQLLGGVAFRRDGDLVTSFRSRKAEAILAYLIMQKRPIARTELATIFWQDSDPTQAMTNLRKITHDMRKQLGDWLIVTRHTLAFDETAVYHLDVDQLTAGFTAVPDSPLSTTDAAPLADALAQFKGEFLAGLHVNASPDFDDWAALERERINLQVSHHLNRITNYCLHNGRYTEGIMHAHRWIALDPYHEEAHRRLIRLLARDGQLNAALTQYATCCQVLADELGVEPAQATQLLRQRLTAARNAPLYRLPAPYTPFIGRETELAQLDRSMDDPETHLVTLLGLGGGGKTRLALQIGARRQGEYLDGVLFVSLTAVSQTAVNVSNSLIQTIADAMGIAIQGGQSPQTQLINQLRDKEMLLILDNVEQIVDATASLITAVLANAPRVQLLITSRERLALRAERIVRLHGLSYKTDDSDAMRLFQSRVKAILPDFDIKKGDQAAIFHQSARKICDLMEGLPLGIELAAAALPYHPLPQIVTEIERNVNFIAIEQRDLPPRQRSLRAAFIYSWQLLTAPEQNTFAQLTLFRGGFSAEAAREVAMANNSILRGLADKTMMYMDENGRYHIHELLRQFAAEQLEDETAVGDRHSHYFARFLQTFEPQLKGDQQAEAAHAIQQEINNVRAGWDWGIKQGDWLCIGEYAIGMHLYLEIKSAFQEGEERFAQALAALRAAIAQPDAQLALGRILARLGFFCERLARIDEADAYLEESLAVLQQLGAVDEAIFVSTHIGVAAYHRGDYDRALPQFEQALALNREVDNQQGIAQVQNHIAALLYDKGDFKPARAACEESLQIHRALGNELGIAMSSNTLTLFLEVDGDMAAAEQIQQENLERCMRLEDRMGEAMTRHKLGNYARQRGDLAVAGEHYRQGHALFAEQDSPWIDALFSTRLGDVADAAGDLDEAAVQYNRALAICQKIGDQRGVAITLLGLGRVELKNGRLPIARTHLQEALTAAQTTNAPSAVLDALAMWALLLAQTGKQTKALTLALFVDSHPACTTESKTAVFNLVAKANKNANVKKKAAELSLETAVEL